MAFSIKIDKSVQAPALREKLTALLRAMPTESYPNGNGGYSQSAAYRINRVLKDAGLPLQLVTVWYGDAHTVGGKRFALIQKGYAPTQARAMYKVLAELTESFREKRWKELPFDTDFCKLVQE